MKKLFLYLFLFSSFLISSSYALLINKNHNISYSNNSLKKSFTKFEISKSTPTIIKTDLIDDFENDNEDEDFQSIINRNNYSIATFFSFKNKAISLNFVPKKTINKNYFYCNFSKLPRLNYISLNVFLI